MDKGNQSQNQKVNSPLGPIDPNVIIPIDPTTFKDVEPTAEMLEQLNVDSADSSNQTLIPSDSPKGNESITPPIDTPGDSVLRENIEVEALGKKEEIKQVVVGGSGINLIPTLSAEEEKIEKRKSGANYATVFFTLFIAVISVAIVGFNFINRSILDQEKRDIKTLENKVKSNSNIISSNEAILQRVELYEDIQSSTFSPKEVFLYWLQLSNEFGEIGQVELNGGLEFSFTGEADSLVDTARLWHLLSVDERVAEINLESVAKSETGVNYTFTGSLDFEYFVANQTE